MKVDAQVDGSTVRWRLTTLDARTMSEPSDTSFVFKITTATP